MVCQTEQIIGFRWIRGKWKSTDFIPERFIIEKLAVRPGANELAGCQGIAESAAVLGEDLLSVPGCYAIRREEQKASTANGQICNETHVRMDGKWLIKAISCEKFTFRPDGWLHRTSLHADLDDMPEGDEKDSLSVAVGHCRTVK